MTRFFRIALLLLVPALAQAAEDRSVRSKVVRNILPMSVRVQVLTGDTVRRTASGVVVYSEVPQRKGVPPRSGVMTNAHVIDPGTLEDVSYRVLVEKRGRVIHTLPAKLLGMGEVPDMDLGLLEVEALLPAARIADENSVDVGDDVVVVGAPYGKALSVSGGMISQLEAETGEENEPLRFKAMKTDAAIGYGSSGGGVFLVPGGELVGIVEGYRTARVTMSQTMAFDVPMPGETFIAPVTKVRRFLDSHRQPQLRAAPSDTRAASVDTGKAAQR